MSNSSIWSIHRTLSGDTTPSQSGPGSDSNEGVCHIPQTSSITGASPSDCLVSYSGHSLRCLTSLQRCSLYILQHQPTGLPWERYESLHPINYKLNSTTNSWMALALNNPWRLICCETKPNKNRQYFMNDPHI